MEGQRRLLEGVIAEGLCVRCGACVGLCPYLDFFDGRVVVVDPCPVKDTFRCVQVCPRADVGEIPMHRDETKEGIGPFQEIFMARAAEESIRAGAQYGGVVTSLILFALDRQVISSAILTDRGDSFAPRGRLVRSRTEVLACAGSRYAASGGLSAMNRAIGKGGDARLGVVGLPCQMEAIARMGLVAPDGKERVGAVLLRIGLFCTWALDPGLLETYLRHQDIQGPILKADIPPPPAEVFRIKTLTGWRDFPLSDIRSMIQKGCSLCGDMTAEHADISVGAAEGLEGWNTVIVRTDRGARLIQGAVGEGWIERGDLPGENLEHLQDAARNKRKRVRQALSGPDSAGEA